MNTNEAKKLLNSYSKGDCTPRERELVDHWYAELDNSGDVDLTEAEKNALRDRMAAWLEAKMAEESKVVPISASPRRNWVRWAAAAAVLVMISATAYWYIGQQQPQTAPAVAVVNPETILAPDNVRATVTLSDGTVVPLDSLGAEALAEQSGVKLVHLPNGELVYEAQEGSAAGPELFNTLRNPRGSRVATLVLADGSRVWLNAGSSITYPIAFTRNKRQVSIAGEAYFEVTKDASRPFTVAAGQTEVAVLGTHFNVNAYGDEADALVTLLEGSVNVIIEGGTALLSPGQQAIVTNNIAVSNNADLVKVMAWKNGIFHFENAGIQQVMQEIGRWYDMDVEILDNRSKRQFGGEISRSSSLGQVLTILQESGVRFSVRGKTISVISAQ